VNSQEPGGALLASVSRSFYLTIKALPRDVRAPIGLAYLLARAADTIADSPQAPAACRLHHLDALREMIRSGADKAGLARLEKEITPPDPSERALIGRLGECLAWLASMPEDDRADIVWVLEKITRGQELDLRRFGGEDGVCELQSAADLDEYTYLVAGCVGEFWTRLCFRRLRHYAALDETRMRLLGVNFGKGLQLVNILRDLPSDLRAGRCYLPLAEAGLHAKQIRRTPLLARPIFESWLARAVKHLDDAYHYIRAINGWRLRYACILPWILGMRTLILLRKTPPLETSVRVKVSRAEVRVLLCKALLGAFSNRALRTVRARLARDF
jgi:farnesyl-diphosphate farnesyltransferase